MQVCRAEGCGLTFTAAKGYDDRKFYCSKACRDRAAIIRRTRDGRRQAADARYEAKEGGIRKIRSKLRRRIAANLQRLETL